MVGIGIHGDDRPMLAERHFLMPERKVAVCSDIHSSFSRPLIDMGRQGSDTGSNLDWTRMALLRKILAISVAIGLLAEPAFAYQGGEGMVTNEFQFASQRSVTATEKMPFLLAAADCSGAASRAARQTGGQVLSVSTQSQGGQTVCVVTVLVPGKGNQRPRKQTVTIKP